MDLPKIRLYVDHPLASGNSVPLDRDHANYLFNVMRLGVGAQIGLFNGRDGEFAARIEDAGKRRGLALCEAQVRAMQMPPDLWLLFAPIKKARTDFIVEKATEMGAARILPTQTDFTNAERIRQDRLQAHAIEAAEQCGGTFVPPVAPLAKLSERLDQWPAGRAIMFATRASWATPTALSAAQAGPWAILIGPEGGFSGAERTRLAAHPATTAISLGPRILRADTAAVAALTLWQSALGDWR